MTLPAPVQQAGVHFPDPAGGINLSPLAPSDTITSQEKRDSAWRYEGYQAFTKWMASDDDFFVFRRFESLNAQVLLWMQDRIVRMENKLQDIHKLVEGSDRSLKLTNGSFRTDETNLREREEIMRELSATMHHYNEYIETFSKVRMRPRAGKHHIRNLQNWLHRDAIDPEEAQFASEKGDLISINYRTRLPMGRWLESFSKFRFSRILRAKPLEGVHVPSDATTYSNNETFERLTNATIIFVGLVMLLAPMWWLENVSNSETRLKIITGFVCIFIIMMTTATINRPFEVVAATAAYAAVLMVFMQIERNKS